MKKLLCVVGPTASGKTALAIALAKYFNGEIIGCDSVQVYRGLNIGSAKPEKSELDGIKHHMLDIVEPVEDYTAFRYAEDAGRIIDNMKCLPIVCGGTGLYLKALTRGLDDIPQCPRIDHGKDAYEKLCSADPVTAKRLSPNDKTRVFRALDVFEHTGRPISSFFTKRERLYEPFCIGIDFPREELYSRINKRTELMLENGLLEETLGLLESGVPAETKSMKSLGYAETAAYLCGKLTLTETRELIRRNTRRYAKRQITWFSHQEDVKWLDSKKNLEEGINYVEKFFFV